MPLLALVDGARTVSTLLADQDWLQLQADVRHHRRALEMQPCGLPGHLRTSKRGTRHFAHNGGGGHCTAHEGESSLHLTAKAEIIRGCTDAGWIAEPERPGDGWIADVAAAKDRQPRTFTVAFEVQVSRQTDDDYLHRQDRYQQAGIRSAWFVRHQASLPTPTSALPVFLLEGPESALTTDIGSTTLTLRDAAASLVRGQVQFRNHVTDGHPATEVVMHESDPCWNCRRTYLLWKVLATTTRGACGMDRTYPDPGIERYAQTRPEAQAEIVSAVVTAARGSKLRPAGIRTRSSKTAQTTYMGFSCPHCGALYGDFFLPDFWANALYEQPAHTLEVEVPPTALAPEPHWCLDLGRGHCTQIPDPALAKRVSLR